MHNTEFVQGNETHKILWDFRIQTDHLISTRRPDLVIIKNKPKKKKTAIPVDHRVKLKENEKRGKCRDLAWELEKKKLWYTKATMIANEVGMLGTVTQSIATGTGGFENKRMSGDHSNYSIVKIGQNTKSWRLEETCSDSN